MASPHTPPTTGYVHRPLIDVADQDQLRWLAKSTVKAIALNRSRENYEMCAELKKHLEGIYEKLFDATIKDLMSS